MTSIRFILHQIVVLLFVFVSLLFLNTCKEDAPTEPEGNNTNDDVLASSTIGPSGGELKTEDFALVVPTGSFVSETKLSLLVSDKESAFGENTVTQTFIVEGIPENFTDQIQINIKHDGILSDSNQIVLGTDSEDYLSGNPIIRTNFITAYDSSGFLVGYLVNKNNNKKIFRPKNNIFSGKTKIFGVTDYMLRVKELFKVKASGGWSDITLDRIGNTLLEIKSQLENDWQFKYKLNGIGNCPDRYWKWKWPIEVVIADVDSKITLDYTHSWFSDIGPQIVVDGSLLDYSNQSEAKGYLCQALLTLSINTYDNYCDERKWVEYAAVEWFRGYYDKEFESKYPSGIIGNELEPFFGIQFGYEQNRPNFRPHGKGFGSVIKYLEKYQNFGEMNFSKTFEDIHSKNMHPTQALLSNIDTLIAVWWPDFFEKYISGEVCDVRSFIFTDNLISDKWDINSNTDTVESFTLEYPDLSAKRFIINLNYSDIDESAKLNLDAFSLNNDGIATLLFGVKSDGNLQYIIAAKNAPLETPESLKSYYDEGIKKFLVVVVNSIHNATDYLGNTDIELKMKVTKEEPTPDYNSIGIGMYIGTRYAYTTPDTSYETENERIGFGVWEGYPGSFSGNTFNASYYKSWDSQTNPLTITGTITATFNNDFTIITTITWNETHVGKEFSNSVDLTAVNIPLDYDEWGDPYQVKMEKTCEHIVSFTDVQTSSDGLSWTMPEYWCNNDSKISIRLKTK